MANKTNKTELAAVIAAELVDHPTLHSYCLGFALTALCIPGLIGNCLVAYVEIKKDFLNGTNSSVYQLSFNLIVADTLHLACLAFYLGPSSALQDWLLPDNWTREIPGRFLMFVWENMLVDLVLLGANRYVAVCKPQYYQTLFSKRNTKIMIGISWVLALLICATGEQFLPCCSVYLYYKVFSYAFPKATPGVSNYNNMLVLIPVNTFTSIFVFVTYAVVIYNIHATNNRVADKITAESQVRRRNKEIRYAMQLTIISSVFVAVWVMFNILGNAIPPEQAANGWFSIVVMLEIINGSANSFVCILFNKEIKTALKKKFCCCKQFDEVTTTSVVQLAAGQTTRDTRSSRPAGSDME